MEWIQSNTELVAAKDLTTALDASSFNAFMRKNKNKNIFLFAYVSMDTRSHSAVISFMQASRAFKVCLLFLDYS